MQDPTRDFSTFIANLQTLQTEAHCLRLLLLGGATCLVGFVGIKVLTPAAFGDGGESRV